MNYEQALALLELETGDQGGNYDPEEFGEAVFKGIQAMQECLKRGEVGEDDLNRCCRNCVFCNIDDKTCSEGGFTEIGNIDAYVSPVNCSAWKERIKEPENMVEEYALSIKQGRQPNCIYCGKPLDTILQTQFCDLTWTWNSKTKQYHKSDSGDAEKPCCGNCEAKDWNFCDEQYYAFF